MRNKRGTFIKWISGIAMLTWPHEYKHENHHDDNNNKQDKRSL